MIKVLAALMVWGGLIVQANAANYDHILGTVSVSFQPIATEGVIEGCSLVYNAVALDHAYRKGNPVLGVGNFTVMGSNKQWGMTLKIGVADVLKQQPKAEAPNYAYIKTPNGSTAGVQYKAVDSDMAGFRMFVYEVNKKSLGVVYDLIQGINPTIGFNRVKGGMDVMIPIDLTVADAKTGPDGSRIPIRSQEAVNGFGQCLIELAERLK